MVTSLVHWHTIMSEYDLFDWRPDEDPDEWKQGEDTDPNAWKKDLVDRNDSVPPSLQKDIEASAMSDEEQEWLDKNVDVLLDEATSASTAKPIHVVQQMVRTALPQNVNISTRANIMNYLPLALRDDETRNVIGRQYELSEHFLYASEFLLDKSVYNSELAFADWRSVVKLLSAQVAYRARKTIAKLTAQDLVANSPSGKKYAAVVMFQQEYAELALKALQQSTGAVAHILDD